MYWSDWGNHPKIETAAMDGTLRETLVQDNIQWPTGPRGAGVGRGRGRLWSQLLQKSPRIEGRGAGPFPPDRAEGRGSGFQMGDWERSRERGGAALDTRQNRRYSLHPAWRGRGRPSPPSLTPGLAVDYHNERLYWADAKLSVIGSIRLNGTDPIVAADSKRGERGAASDPNPAHHQASRPSIASPPSPFIHSTSTKGCGVSRGGKVSCDPWGLGVMRPFASCGGGDRWFGCVASCAA